MEDKVWEQQQKDNWLRLLRSGDHQAFAEFIDKYKEAVFLCCRRLGLREDEVEDVASETFLAAYNGLSRYRGQAELSTWLWKIAYYKSVSFIRKKGRRSELFTELDSRLADERNNQLKTEIESKEQAEIVWRAVECLPKLWAFSIVLFYREEKSISEIAKIMKKRENTVKTYLFRGRKRLKELLANILGEDSDVGR